MQIRKKPLHSKEVTILCGRAAKQWLQYQVDSVSLHEKKNNRLVWSGIAALKKTTEPLL
jgi:hypothetical protein